jgi:hypothetical protein
MLSYAQNREDVLLARALSSVKNGFYVDVGANDPVHDSVTKHFYDQGWSGINIEASPTWFAKLQEQRPKDLNLNLAASDQTANLRSMKSKGPDYLRLSMSSPIAERNGASTRPHTQSKREP